MNKDQQTPSLGGKTTQTHSFFARSGRFRVLGIAMDVISGIRPLVGLVERRDKDLARQLRRSASSIALNLSEGQRRVGKDRLHLYRVAMGSADETRMCLHIAAAWGYVELPEAEMDALDRIVATLWKITNR